MYLYKGFTLVELLIVVAILGIIAAIGFPMYSGHIESAREKEAIASLQSIAMMQEQYQLQNNASTYWTSANNCGDYTNQIETTLFDGDNSLNDEKYYYCIIPFNNNGYKIIATSKANSEKKLCLDNSNETSC